MKYSEIAGQDETLVFLDLETTGLNPSEDRIIEIGAVKVRGNKIIEKFQSLINPEIHIPLSTIRLSGITDEKVKEEGKKIEEVKSELLDFLGPHTIVGHNVSFDKEFLSTAGISIKNKFLDTCELACILLPTLKTYSLSHLIKRFNLRNKEEHRAIFDAEDTYRLWLTLFDTIKEEDYFLIKRINRLMAQSQWPFKETFQKLERVMEGTGSEPYPEHKSYVRETKNYEPEKKVRLNTSQILSLFEKEGFLSKNLPEYEFRPQQKEMAKIVCQAFNEDKHLLVEAGTGVGKSLAYLIPAIYWAVNNQVKVVISTNTKNLQNQLWEKELPFLRKSLGIKFESALAKGRENYLCLRRWKKLYEESSSLFEEEKMALLYLLTWRYKTRTGLLEEISPWYQGRFPQIKDISKQIYSERDACLGRYCPFRNSCFYQNVRKETKKADLIISNHALTLSPPIWFPPFSHLILDEAQNIEDVATDLYTKEVSSFELLSLLKWIYAGRERYGEKISSTVEELMDKTMRDFSALLLSSFKQKEEGEKEETYLRKNIILRRLKINQKWEKIKVVWENLIARMSNLEKLFLNLEKSFQKSKSNKSRIREILGDISMFRKKVSEGKENLGFILKEEDEKYVYWVEKIKLKKKGMFGWILKAAPLNTGKFLNDHLYEEMASVILTSATLTVERKFDFFLQRLGFADFETGRTLTKFLGSPFNYPEQVNLGIPVDFPSYNYENPERFITELSKGIEETVKILRGKILILFNSLIRMEEIYRHLKPELEKENILLLCQNHNGSRSALIERIKNSNEDSVLLGAKSFREGVDISGLTCVIIEKLPFPNPNEPMIQGRREYMESSGKNSFTEYILPLTIIGLRQGFGRLIRRKRDRGVVIIFDSRICQEYPGVLRSLPACRKVCFKMSQLTRTLKYFSSKMIAPTRGYTTNWVV